MRFVGACAGLILATSVVPAAAQGRPDTAATLAAQRSAVSPLPETNTPARIDLPTPVALPEAVQSGANAGVFIGAVNIEGSAAIPVAEFSPIVERFLGKSADGAALQSLARSVADRARAQGYIFASAMVPQQEISFGIVRVKLDEGSVDTVRIVGSTNRKLNRLLSKLEGTPATRTVLERYLLLAGDIPGVTVIRTRFERENGRGILIVDVREDRADGQLWLDNHGSSRFGPLRTRAQAELNSLVIAGDNLTTQLLITPVDIDELAFASLRYAVPVGNDGATVSLSLGAGRTRTIDRPSGVAINGRNQYGALGASYPLLRSNAKSLWLSAELSALSVDQEALGQLIQSDTIVTASAALNGQVQFAGGWLNGGIGAVQGLGGFGTTGPRDPLASRGDGSGRFAKLYGWAQWTRGLGSDFSLRLGASGQLASRPLLAAQELSIGGPGFGRGYDFSERFGDQGILGLVELRRDFERPLPYVKWAQIYGFADGGYVDNLRDGFGGGTLLSAGGGVRARVGPTEFSLEAAAPLNTARAESGNKDPRVNFAVGLHF